MSATDVAGDVAAWAAALAGTLTVLSTLGRARSRNRARHNLRADLALLEAMPEGPGKDALTRAVDAQAERISSRTVDGWRFDLVRFMVLAGAVSYLAALLTGGLLLLDEEGVATFSFSPSVATVLRGIAGFYAVLGAGVFTVGAMVGIGRWLYERSDERVRRLLTAAQFRETFLQSRRSKARSRTGDASNTP